MFHRIRSFLLLRLLPRKRDFKIFQNPYFTLLSGSGSNLSLMLVSLLSVCIFRICIHTFWGRELSYSCTLKRIVMRPLQSYIPYPSIRDFIVRITSILARRLKGIKENESAVATTFYSNNRRSRISRYNRARLGVKHRTNARKIVLASPIWFAYSYFSTSPIPPRIKHNKLLTPFGQTFMNVFDESTHTKDSSKEDSTEG